MDESTGGGDAAARFRALVDETFTDLIAYASRRTDTAEDAQDAVNETYLVAWRRLGDVPTGDGARLWLFATARRVLANTHRASGRRRRLLDRLRVEHPGPTLVPDVAEASRGAGAVGDAFSRLRAHDREVLVLAGWEDLDAAGIAAVLGCSPATARVRLHRARRRFAAELDRQAVTEVDDDDPRGRARPQVVQRTRNGGHIPVGRPFARPETEEAL